MKHNTLLIITFFTLCFANAQVGVNTTDVEDSAILDIESNGNKGLLIPRVALNDSQDSTGLIPNPTTSTLIYNTANQNDVSAGYYYFNGTFWERINDTRRTYANATFTNRVVNPRRNLNTNTLLPIFHNAVNNDDATLYNKLSETSIQILGSGRYELGVDIYLRSTQSEIQPYCQFEINGVPTGAIAATGFMLDDDDNETTSLNLFDTFQLNHGDVITIRMKTYQTGYTYFSAAGSSFFNILKLK